MKVRNETKDIRVFAGGIGVIFSIFSAISFYKSGYAWKCMLPPALLFAVIGLAKPALIRPIYLKWMIAAGFIAKVQTTLLLYILYFFVITPIGLFMKLIGKDLLDEKTDKTASTHWKEKEPERGTTRYTQQF